MLSGWKRRKQGGVAGCAITINSEKSCSENKNFLHVSLWHVNYAGNTSVAFLKGMCTEGKVQDQAR